MTDPQREMTWFDNKQYPKAFHRPMGEDEIVVLISPPGYIWSFTFPNGYSYLIDHEPFLGTRVTATQSKDGRTSIMVATPLWSQN